MSRSDDEHVMRRCHGFEEHIAGATTTHAELWSEPERFGSRERSRCSKKLCHRMKDRSLDGASANGSERRAVLKKRQLLTRCAGCRAAPSHHCRHDDTFTSIERCDDSPQDVGGTRGSGHQGGGVDHGMAGVYRGIHGSRMRSELVRKNATET